MPTSVITKEKGVDFSKAAGDAQIARAKMALQANGFKLKVVDTLEQAKQEVENIIPAGSEVFTATSVTLDEAGLTEELNSDKYVSVRDKFMPLAGQPDKAVEMGALAPVLITP